MNDLVLKIKNFKIFDKEGKLIINVPNLEVNRGSTNFIIGDNGSGKSTFIKSLFSPFNSDTYFDTNEDSIATLFSNYGYQLELNNNVKIDANKSLQSFIYVDQNEFFGSHDSVFKSLEIQGKVALNNLKYEIGDKYFEKNKLLDELVEKYALLFFEDLYCYDKKYKNKREKSVAINILKKKRIYDCSGGQKKMVSLLSSLIKSQIIEPDLIVLDEPLNHLDHRNKCQICDLLTDIRNQRKDKNPVTLLIISHCLVFDFINDSDCYQYKIVNSVIGEPIKNKIYHNCLKSL